MSQHKLLKSQKLASIVYGDIRVYKQFLKPRVDQQIVLEMYQERQRLSECILYDCNFNLYKNIQVLKKLYKMCSNKFITIMKC